MTVLNWPLLISVMALIVATIALTISRLNKKTIDGILVYLSKQQKSPGAQPVEAEEQTQFQGQHHVEQGNQQAQQFIDQGMRQLDVNIEEMNRTINEVFGNQGRR